MIQKFLVLISSNRILATLKSYISHLTKNFLHLVERLKNTPKFIKLDGLARELRDAVVSGNIFSLDWAIKTLGKMLALLLSIIAGSIALILVGLLMLSVTYSVIDNLPYYGFMMAFTLVSTGVIAISAVFFPIARRYVVNSLTVGNGKTVLIVIVGIMWFFVIFHRAIAEKPAHVEMASTLVVSGILLWIVSTAYVITTTGRIQIVSAVSGYICIMLLYGGIYNLIFIWRPVSYIFSPEIIAGAELRADFDARLVEIRELQYQRYLASIIQDNPDAGFKAASAYKNGDEEIQEIDSHLSIKFIWIPDPPGGDEMHLIVFHNENEIDMSVRGRFIRHPEHELIYDIYFAKSVDDFRGEVDKLIETYEEKLDRQTQIVNSTFAGNPNWDFQDFLYFSATTQITANLGEIVPNSRLVRYLVISQGIIGLFDAGFAIWFLRGGDRSDDSTET